jgi:glycosyltransferase involved in cell wall biosynthesis
MASRLAGCKCIETFHGVEDNIIRFSLPRQILFRIASSMTHSVTAVAGAAADLMIKLTGIKKSKIRVIPNAVDADLFKPCPSREEKDRLRKELNLPEASLLFGCVAALRPVKNHHGLLKAFAEAVSGKFGNVPNSGIHLVLVGDGVLEGELRRLATDLGIGQSVMFLGRHNDIHKLLQALDVFILNSKTEGMSYAILEAMATGLPVIATAVGANAELIGHGKEGYLVPQGNGESMSRYIYLVSNDRSSLLDMGKSARKKIVEFYALDKMITSYENLYREVYEEA